MRQNTRMAFRTSMESLAEEATQVIEAEAAAPIDEQVTDQAVEAEIATEIAQEEELHDEYQQASATLESIISALEQSRVSGGLTPQGARFAQISFESVARRLTGESPTVVSYEAVGGLLTHEKAAEDASASAKGFLTRVWEAIVRVLNNIIKAGKRFFSYIFDRGERYKQRAIGLAEAIRHLDPKPSESEFDFSDASKIAIGTKVDIANLKDLESFVIQAGKLSEASHQSRESFKEFSRQFASSQGNDPDARFSALLIRTLNPDLYLSENYRPIPGSEDNQNRLSYQTDVLPGNVRLKWVSYSAGFVPPSEEAPDWEKFWSAIKNMAALFAGYKHEKEQVDAEVSSKVSTLSLDQIRDLTKTAISLVQKSEKGRRIVDAESELDITVDFNEMDMLTAMNVRSAITGFSSAVRQMSEGSMAQFSYAIGAVGHFLDYGVQSAKRYPKAA